MNLTESIIYSKIYPPKIHENIVFRKNIHDILNQGLTKKLTYISSPAGFGKTTLLAEWIKTLKKPVAWITLDEKENDLKTFFKYFILAIQENINPKFGKLAIEEAQNSYFDLDRCITLILNDFIFYPSDYLIIIDNFNFISEPKIAEAISFIINHLPDNAHLYISSKTKNESIKYSKLRAENNLIEIEAEQLKFSIEDLKKFYQIKDLKISDKQLTNIQNKTEGWILSIHLSSIFIKDTDIFDNLDNKLIIDYVFDEVLEKINPDIVKFLIRISILSKFNYQICNYLNEISDSNEIINYLDKNNIFITPVDHKGEYYRFHNLFSEILLKKFKQIYSNESELELREKAYQWYRKNNFIDEALEQSYILAKEDEILALLNSMIQSNSEIHINDYYIKYMNSITVEKLVKYPELCFSYLRYLIYTFKLERSNEIISYIEENECNTSYNLASYILFSKAYKNYFEENIEQSLEYIKLCIESNKNNKDLFMLSNCYIALSSIYLRKSHFSESLEIMNKGISIYKKTESSELEILSDMLFILISLNRLSEAEEKCNYINENLDKSKFSLNYESIKVKSLLAKITIYFYQNKDFESLVKELLQFLKNNENLALLCYTYMSLANIYIGIRKFNEAEVFIKSAEIIENGNLSIDLIFLKARFNLHHNKAHVSKEMFMNIEPQLNINSNPDLFLVIIHTHICLNELAKAEKIINIFFELHPEKESIYVIYNLVFKSLILFLKGKDYTDILISALKMTKKSEIINIYSDFSEEINTHINKMITEFSKKIRNNINPIIENAYLEKILVSFYQKSKRDILEKEIPLINLTKREIELLDMLEKRFTNNEISEQFYVSINTIKTHIKNIYKKLGVTNREDAILKYKAITSI